ncbi:hypothetical protein Z951_46850 [Streptomyces sp. PRh5]|nr:hypothetical protein Z951_46850 [Streptomyces sp. PRh5]
MHVEGQGETEALVQGAFVLGGSGEQPVGHRPEFGDHVLDLVLCEDLGLDCCRGEEILLS